MTWLRHQMKIFSALLALCAGNSPVTGEFPTQRPVTRSFDVFFGLRPNKPLSKQSWGTWFETPSRSLWLHCYGINRRVSFWNWRDKTDGFFIARQCRFTHGVMFIRGPNYIVSNLCCFKYTYVIKHNFIIIKGHFFRNAQQKSFLLQHVNLWCISK